jgi:hypothetical protein
MKTQGNSLYLTGMPFGFAAWDIGSNPQSPMLLFAVSDNINNLGPAWVVDWYASNALAINGSYAYMSGVAGTSVISFSPSAAAIATEVNRYPPPSNDPNSTAIPQDLAFAYTAIAINPNMPIAYGFTQSDSVYTLGMGGNGTLSQATRTPYAGNGGETCCVSGAATFGNDVFVAFRQALWIYGMNGDGSLSAPLVFSQMQAVNVAATSRYLYVQHQPQGGGGSYPAGIYVFNQNGNYVTTLDLTPTTFTVSQNDQYLYANNDGTTVRIYQIQWTN